MTLSTKSKFESKVEELEPAEQDDGPVNSVKERVNSLEARVNDLENGSGPKLPNQNIFEFYVD